MKHCHNTAISVFLAVILLFTAVVPVYATDEPLKKPWIEVQTSLNRKRICYMITYHNLGDTQYTDFRIQFDPDTIGYAMERVAMWTCDFIFRVEASADGVLLFRAKPTMPKADTGYCVITLDVLDPYYEIALLPGDYADLNGVKGKTEIKETGFTINDVSENNLVGMPENKKAADLRIGDVTFDGKIAADDARMILRAAVRLEELSIAQIACADMDYDHSITANDALFALRDAVGL